MRIVRDPGGLCSHVYLSLALSRKHSHLLFILLTSVVISNSSLKVCISDPDLYCSSGVSLALLSYCQYDLLLKTKS